MSVKNQTAKLCMGFVKKFDMRRFQVIEVNFEVRYEDHQNCSKPTFYEYSLGF